MIRTDDIRLPDWQVMKDIDEAGYTYLGILETDKIKEKAIIEKFSEEYLRQLRMILRSKLNAAETTEYKHTKNKKEFKQS